MNPFFKSPKALIIIPLLVVWLAGLPVLVPYNSDSSVPSMELGQAIYRVQQLAQTVQGEDSFHYQFNQAVEAILVTAGLKICFQAPETVNNLHSITWIYLPPTNKPHAPSLTQHPVVIETVHFQSIPSSPSSPPPRFSLV